MVSHTYHIHLDSPTIRLTDVDDLLGKDVEIIVRERQPTATSSNFDVVNQLLTEQANPDFFRHIVDPVTWQQQIRDEWE